MINHLCKVVQLASEESGMQNHSCLLLFFIKVIGVTLLIKLYRFQVPDSVMHHLHIALCAHHLKSGLSHLKILVHITLHSLASTQGYSCTPISYPPHDDGREGMILNIWKNIHENITIS